MELILFQVVGLFILIVMSKLDIAWSFMAAAVLGAALLGDLLLSPPISFLLYSFLAFLVVFIASRLLRRPLSTWEGSALVVLFATTAALVA